MAIKKKQRRRWMIFFTFAMCIIIFLIYSWNDKIPDSIYLEAGERNEVNLRLPFNASIEVQSSEAVMNKDIYVAKVNPAINQPFSIYIPKTGKYELSL